MAAQLVHAAGESSPGNISEGTHAVVLSVKGEHKLLDLERKLIDLQIPHKAIREPDLPWDGQIMAIGLFPTFKTPVVKKLLSQYPLLR